MSKIAGPSSCNLSVINSTGARAHHLLKSVNRPITSRQRNRFHMNVISAKRHARVRNLPRSTTDVGVTDRHVPQRVRCVEGLIRTVLSVLRVVRGLPTTQGHSLITLLTVNYLITLSLLHIVTTTEGLLTHIHTQKHRTHRGIQRNKGNERDQVTHRTHHNHAQLGVHFRIRRRRRQRR